jgi:hypothetical protein
MTVHFSMNWGEAVEARVDGHGERGGVVFAKGETAS